MGLLSILGFGEKSENIKDFLAKSAVIIDVRTVGEFHDSHIKGSKNFPLDGISSKTNEIKSWNKPVIVCCKSGMRSAQAASILKKNGIEVINGGSWTNVERNL